MGGFRVQGADDGITTIRFDVIIMILISLRTIVCIYCSVKEICYLQDTYWG